MKAKQIGARCFELVVRDGEAPAALSYIETYKAILSRHITLITGEYDKTIDEALKKSGLTYAWAPRDHELFAKPIASEARLERPSAQEFKTLIARRPVRSGERIEAQGDAIFLERINSGAEILALGNCFVLAPLYGLCNAQGEFAIVKEVGRGGLFIFRGVVYESAFFDGPKRFFTAADKIIAEEHL
ncbi:MAG: hypothetical protein LBF86_01630 [Helicobacteraceae bacterium]|jgi:septum formation inhibitor MinC|nr:hypothetical protein [Helicobacteraceae bacterium]